MKIFSLILCLFLGVAVAICYDGMEKTSRRDVFLITIDTLRSDHVRCYGYERIETPAMDQLARQGIRFAHAFTPSPITNTSHTSILTGLLRGPSGKPLDLDNLAERVVKPTLRQCAVCKKLESKHDNADHDSQLDTSLPVWWGWYSLRRGVGTAVASLAKDSLAAKGLLRHSSVSTTERHYIKDVPESTLQAMKQLEALCNECATEGETKPN